jgi:CRISPR-associated protein Cas1
MRKLLNTLYVTSPDSYLSCDGENIVVKSEGKDSFRIPVHNLEGIVMFGYSGASPACMHLCAERGVSLSFLKESGQFMARVQGKVSGNVLLRRKQYRAADTDHAVRLAKQFTFAKLANSRNVLNRGIRDHAEAVEVDKLQTESRVIKQHLQHILSESITTLDHVRGIEGDAAKHYFSGVNELILVDKDMFFMKGRNRRPPLDRMNALLSFLYSMLRHEVQSALESVGLDPAVGFLHRDRPGRPSLALDMMEELRAYIADRLALTLINRKQISSKDFVVKENGAILLKPEARKEVITSWQKRKQEEISHPYLGEKIKIGLLPYVQALLLARHLRGDLEQYPPFLWK